MSKKKKSVPAVTSSRPVVKSDTLQPTPTAPVNRVDITKAVDITEADRPFELIRFDKRVKWFLGISLGLFLILTLAKINYSSVAIWNQILPDGSDLKRGLLAGKPRQIRMDDWAGATPMQLSQVNNGFPLQNQALGGEKPPLVTSVPTHHFITIIRPENWGYHLFDVERGFAWRWNFFIFAGLITWFLTFLVLTRNQFWLSVAGAIWLVLSPGVVWWSFVNLGWMYSGLLLLVSSLYIFYARSIKTMAINGALFAWSLLSFALFLYPPYQIPFGYLLIILLIGFVWRYYQPGLILENRWLKLITFGAALAAAGLFLYVYYNEAKPTIDILANTAYPGRRSETGGTGFVANWFSEYFSGWLLDDSHFPAIWMNICELSHFITFTPIIAVCALVYFYQEKKIDPMMILLLGYILVLYIWIEIGFPEPIAKATLLSMSPTRRTQVPFGITNVVLAVVYLAYIRQRDIKVPGTVNIALIIAAITFMVYAAWLNVVDSGGYFKSHQLFLPTLFFIVLNILLLPGIRLKGKEIIVALAVVFFSLPSLKVNPFAIGLSPITEHVLYQKVNEIRKQDPTARWVVFGSQYITYMVTATGANQLSGMKYMPDFKTMRVLDPQARRDSVYNRFAHVVYAPYINGRDTVVMFNPYQDAYTVAMDPCSPKLKQLNAKYFVFDHVPQPGEIRCMTQITKLGSLEIYKRND
ncbi:DUF7657 domain-containing protein [Spirosoma koreense]